MLASTAARIAAAKSAAHEFAIYMWGVNVMHLTADSLQSLLDEASWRVEEVRHALNELERFGEATHEHRMACGHAIREVNYARDCLVARHEAAWDEYLGLLDEEDYDE